MIRPSPTHLARAGAHPTVWGLEPSQLHDRFWAARGVQVVRLGEPCEIVEDAELFLLTDPRLLAVFNLTRVLEVLNWLKPRVVCLRLHAAGDRGYREKVVTDSQGKFLRFQRSYGGADSRLARVAITPDRNVVRAWLAAPDARTAWRSLRRRISAAHRATLSVDADVYDRTVAHEVMQFTRDLVQAWDAPETTIRRAKRVAPGVWVDGDTQIDAGVKLVGPVWMGVGRDVAGESSVIGPAVLWDRPEARPAIDTIEWGEIEPTQRTETLERLVKPARRTSLSLFSKRAFDVVVALMVVVLTLPLYPIIMLAIWLEDGRPFFFAHRRESMGGKPFPCLKFRSMRKDAEKIKAQLAAQNQADGPQFFIENDPRLTRVGRLLRALDLDELPQFFNVLLGHMSLVGPRPSPFEENQFCPPWREARLSIRPGITGLWQVKRSRLEGLDFQEWIKYDLQYVENAGWRLDLVILWQTFTMILRGILRI